MEKGIELIMIIFYYSAWLNLKNKITLNSLIVGGRTSAVSPAQREEAPESAALVIGKADEIRYKPCISVS